jgi:predicted RNA-binding protein with PUA-like domain
MKSEPEVFSIDDLRRKKVAGWDGVRSYAARRYLRAMREGDLALFYHSGARSRAIVGLMEIVRAAYPDPTAEEPGWDQVDVKFIKKFPAPLTLEEIKRRPALRAMVLLRQGRLSVQPVSPPEWKALLKILEANKD